MTTQPTDERVEESWKERFEKQFADRQIGYSDDFGDRDSFERSMVYDDVQDFIATEITTLLADCEARVKGEVRQKLREIKLLDYYCKCDDVGHGIAIPRAEYDTLLTHLESELIV